MGGADADVDDAFALVDKFTGKIEGAEARMKGTEHLEGDAVSAIEEERKGGAADFAGEACGGGIPFGVFDAAFGPVEVSDFAGGEHDEEAAVAEAFETGSEAFAVLVFCSVHYLTRARRARRGRRVGAYRFGGTGSRPLRYKRIDKDDTFMEGGCGGEESVGDDAVIRPDLFEKGHKDEALKEAEGVVGDDEARTSRGDAGDIGRLDLIADVEMAEHFGGELSGAGSDGIRGGVAAAERRRQKVAKQCGFDGAD